MNVIFCTAIICLSWASLTCADSANTAFGIYSGEYVDRNDGQGLIVPSRWDPRFVRLQEDSGVRGSDLLVATFEESDTEATVLLEFADSVKGRLGEFTSKFTGNMIFIVVNGSVIASPRIVSPTYGGQFALRIRATRGEMQDLLAMGSGRPFPYRLVIPIAILAIIGAVAVYVLFRGRHARLVIPKD